MKRVGILTAGGDCPGINAALKGVVAPLLDQDIEVIGFLDGFRGLVENQTMPLSRQNIFGIISRGGTILGTSRFDPETYPLPGGGKINRRAQAIETYKSLGLDGLICIGGGATQTIAYSLLKRGLENIITIPKTIDNDVYGTDTCFGYDSALTIACEAIDRLNTTASSHHRCMLVDVMGRDSGWLALGAGISGGADIILVPEWAFYQEELIQALETRQKQGKRFSIIVVAEGAHPRNNQLGDLSLPEAPDKRRNLSALLATFIEEELKIESRVTSLGHIQRGGSPTPRDRHLALLLGTNAAACFQEGRFGVMVAMRGEQALPIPLGEAAGRTKTLPKDHPWIITARRIGISMGR